MNRYFDDLMLGSVELFCLCAEHQSFTAAAAIAGLTPAAVSRSVARLEARMGVQLFVRTTRSVRLTDGGKTYFDHCRPALAQLVEAERELTGGQSSPSGTVRISLPTSYGHYRVLPILSDFRAQYPAVELDVQLSNRNVDFGAEEFDLAVRGRTPPDSGMVARKLEDADVVVVGSPSYLRQHGKPGTLEALQQHDCIQFVLPSRGQAVPWLFRQNGRDMEIPTRGGIRCADDILGPVTLARHGAGLLQTYRFIVEQDLKEGRLEEVLAEFGGASRPFSLLYPSKRHIPQRVRVLIDFFVSRIARTRSSATRPAS